MGHTEDKVVLDGLDDSLWAIRDKESGLCKRFTEGLDRHFIRIALLFIEESPDRKVVPERDLPTEDALKLYGLS